MITSITPIPLRSITGKGIAASNGEPYFPKLQRKGSDKRIIITRNEPNYNPNTAALYENKINSVPIKIRNRYYPARTILFESWTADDATDVDGSTYFVNKYQLLYAVDQHKITLIDTANGPDKNGNHPQAAGGIFDKPFKLNGEGVYLGKASQQDPTIFFTNEFYLNEEANWRALRL
jgi:hypothetical protein